MRRLAFIFPGQGSQYVGMGRQLAEHYPVAAKTFSEANAALGFDLQSLCFNGPEEGLKETAVTQPAILTASVAALNVLLELGARPTYVAGHSLGEYSALVAAGALKFADAVRLVRRRGELMAAAVPDGQGSMAAVLGLEASRLAEACRAASDAGVVEMANLNCPGQIVISGSRAAVQKAGELARAAGAKRVVELQVSGPFHSSLMAPAAEGLSRLLAAVELADPRVKFVANIEADFVETAKEVRERLIRQVVASVRWEESMRRILDAGVDAFVEVGPGKVLNGFIRKIDRDVPVFNAEDPESCQKVLAFLKEGL
ncbi:MAG: ACP S-malonyltransferase [Firmicutes bacterium]|nr:ACP S-malonyltransferase [Bacillota bacterium]